MKTNFFTALNNLQVTGDWNITIKAGANDMMLISVLFNNDAVKDSAKKIIPPLIFKGTANELNEGFFDALEAPIKKTASLLVNMLQYDQAQEKARLASRIEQDKKNKAKTKPEENFEEPENTAPAPSKEDKKKAYELAMTEIDRLTEVFKYDQALALVPDLESYPDKKAAIVLKKDEIQRKQKQYSLL